MKCFISDISYDLICHFIVAYIHQPLCQCRYKRTDPDLNHHTQYPRKIYISSADDKVNCMTCQLWDIQGQSN